MSGFWMGWICGAAPMILVFIFGGKPTTVTLARAVLDLEAQVAELRMQTPPTPVCSSFKGDTGRFGEDDHAICRVCGRTWGEHER